VTGRHPRRRFLATLAGATAVGSLAGCTGRDRVSVLAAGSLQHSLERGLREATEAPVAVEARGSAVCARLVAEGKRDPDVLALADPALFERTGDDWYAAFATNALVLAYTRETTDGRAVGDAERPFDPLLDGVEFGRTDPDLDPLGYRTLFACSLAAEHYDRSELASLPETGRVYPETELLAAFETGGVDAAFVYRSMAAERGYPYRELSATVDLSDPDLEPRYRTRRYELPDGTVVRGGPIRYGVTRREDSAGARAVFDAISRGTVLSAEFDRPMDYPRFVGDAPRA
jgi:molybdate/tungstate transport system substrate-binding protein